MIYFHPFVFSQSLYLPLECDFELSQAESFNNALCARDHVRAMQDLVEAPLTKNDLKELTHMSSISAVASGNEDSEFEKARIKAQNHREVGDTKQQLLAQIEMGLAYASNRGSFSECARQIRGIRSNAHRFSGAVKGRRSSRRSKEECLWAMTRYHSYCQIAQALGSNTLAVEKRIKNVLQEDDRFKMALSLLTEHTLIMKQYERCYDPKESFYDLTSNIPHLQGLAFVLGAFCMVECGCYTENAHDLLIKKAGQLKLINTKNCDQAVPYFIVGLADPPLPATVASVEDILNRTLKLQKGEIERSDYP